MYQEPEGFDDFGRELGERGQQAIDWFTTAISVPGRYTPTPPALSQC